MLTLEQVLARARQTLAGVATDDCAGDNLAIVLCSHFEYLPACEDAELDEHGCWPQPAVDAQERMLDAIHAHYVEALRALR